MESVSRRKLRHGRRGRGGGGDRRGCGRALERGEVTDPSGPPPEEAVVAYVRDAKRGEVTVMSGTARSPTATRRWSSGS